MSRDKSVEIWDTVLTAPATTEKSVEVKWHSLSQAMTAPIKITDDMFSEACDVMNEAETDLLIDDTGQLFTVGMFEQDYALYHVESVKYIELTQFNGEGKYCSHRNLALRVDEKVEDFLHEYERVVREISRADYEAATWYAEKSKLAEDILNSSK